MTLHGQRTTKDVCDDTDVLPIIAHNLRACTGNIPPAIQACLTGVMFQKHRVIDVNEAVKKHEKIVTSIVESTH